jgi:hypothetical protein
VVFATIAGLPGELRQLWREVDCMLTCAAADLQQTSAAMEAWSQHLENGHPILNTGFGKRFMRHS